MTELTNWPAPYLRVIFSSCTNVPQFSYNPAH